jgi:hypothetical protein
MLAYVGKTAGGGYEPFCWQSTLGMQDVEISEETFIIRRSVAETYKAAQTVGSAGSGPAAGAGPIYSTGGGTTASPPIVSGQGTRRRLWCRRSPGRARPPQKWMNFCTKVLSKFSTGTGLKLTLRVEVAPPEGVPVHRIEETRVALRELGLSDALEDQA